MDSKKGLLAVSTLAVFLAVATMLLLAPERAAEPVAGDLPRHAEHRPEGPEFFARYHALIRTRFDDPTRRYATGYRMHTLQAARALAKAPPQTIEWQERGPANVGGRTRALLVDPADSTASTWYAGAVGGGIWKTTDRGQTWRNLTPDLPILAVASLIQSPSNPDVLYAGTGEGFGNPDALAGDGLWKTTDRGQTWSPLVSTVTNADFRAVNRLVVDPENPDIVIAATNTGLFRTTDGGATWTRTLDRPSTGDGRMQQVIAGPAGFDTLYATTNGVGIFKSTDAGQSWTLVFSFEPEEGRLEMAVAPSDTRRLYVAAENGAASDLYLSDDAGATWSLVPEDCFSSLTDPNWLGLQGWYNNSIAVHPENPNQVYVGGIDAWRIVIRNDDGWKRCSDRMTSWIPGLTRGGDCCVPFVHADHHNLIVAPSSESESGFIFLDANDGGVEYNVRLSGLGNEADWRKTTNGYNTAQFYSADKRPGLDEYIGGTQDNGTWRTPGGFAVDATTPWAQQLGGDGFDVAWHAEDPLKIIASIFGNDLWRSVEGGLRWERATNGLTDVQQRGNFMTTIARSRSDPDLLFTTGASGVWRTDTFGERWTLSTLTDPSRWKHTGLRTPAAVSIADPQIVWAGAHVSNDRRLFVSTDGGLVFAPTNPFAMLDAAISGLATHPTDAATAYALFSAPGLPKVLRTRDLGTTWNNLTGTFTEGQPLSSNGFPDVATFSLVVMPHHPDEIWAGTEIGLFISDDGGASWARAETDLPAVAIWQMRIVDDQVIVATHGRGLWTATLPELAGYAPPVATRAPRLNQASMTSSGTLALDVSLRSAYDSLTVALDGVATARFSGAEVAKDTVLLAAVAAGEERDVAVSVTAYRAGRAYRSASETLLIFPPPPAQTTYANDFSVAVDDFFGEGFSTRIHAGFTSNGNALHSEHPYRHGKNYFYQLRVPIEVAAENATLHYRDVAIIEPGRPGSVFGEKTFFDYVVVEGSEDGLTWLPLADGYDARADAAWLAAYQRGEVGTDAMFVEHTLDLLDTFAPGAVVFIRFRLFTDQSGGGWGWVVDDLSIQANQPVTAEDDAAVPDEYRLMPNYPNPFNPTTTIPFSTPRAGPVSIKVYDLQGRLVETVFDGLVAAGTHAVRWDAHRLASGVYFYRLETDHTRLSRSLTLLK